MTAKVTVSLHPLLRELESHLHSHKNSPAAPCPKTDMSITASYARLGRPLPGAPGTWSKDIQRYITKYRYPRYQSTSSDVKNLLKTTACDVPIYQIWVSKHLKIFKISRASCEISRASCEISRASCFIRINFTGQLRDHGPVQPEIRASSPEIRASCENLRASCFIRINFTGQLRDHGPVRPEIRASSPEIRASS